MSNENYIIMKKPKLLNIKKSPQISNFNNKKLEMKQVNQLIKNDQEFEDEEVLDDEEMEVLDESENVSEKALAEPNVIKFMEGKEVVKMIVIPGKIVNIVVK